MFFLQMGWVCLKRVLEKSWPFLFALQGSQEVCCSPLRDESSTGQPPSQDRKERICTPDNQPCPATMTHDHTFPEADQTRHALSRLSFAPSNQQSFSPSKKKKKNDKKQRKQIRFLLLIYSVLVVSCKQHSKRVNVVQKRHCNTIIPCPSFFLKKRDSTSTNNLLCMRLLNICPNGRCHLIRLGKLSFLNHVSKCTGLKTYKRLFFFFSFLRSSHNFCSKNPTLKLCQPNIRFDTGKGVAQVALIRVVNAWKLLIVLTLQTLDKQIDRVLKIGLLRINHQSHFLRRSILGDFLQSCDHVVQFTNLVLMKWFCYFPQIASEKATLNLFATFTHPFPFESASSPTHSTDSWNSSILQSWPDRHASRPFFPKPHRQQI